MVPEQNLSPLSQHPTHITTTPYPTCTSTQDTTLLLKECQGLVYIYMCLCVHTYVLVLLMCELTLAEM